MELSESLHEFVERMRRLKTPLTEVEIRDLATTRFRGGQPKSADDWHDLYRVLKRALKRTDEGLLVGFTEIRVATP